MKLFNYRKWWFWLLIVPIALLILLTMFGMIMALFNPDFKKQIEDSKKVQEHQERAKAQYEERKQIEDSIKIQQDIFNAKNADSLSLVDAIKLINDGVYYQHYYLTKDLIFELTKKFDDWSVLIHKNKENPNQNVAQLAGKLEKLLIKEQKREFPNIRKNYIKAISHTFWRENVEVTTSGKGSNAITFIGGVFAANKNIEEFYKKVDESLSELRFQKVIFMWYKGQDDYTYYTTHAPSDSEIIESKSK